MEKGDVKQKFKSRIPKNVIKMVMIVKMKPTLLLDENNHVDAQKPY
jgi:hypothetical protein